MKKEPKRKQLSELNLTDRFLFDEVVEDPDTHQDMLSIIFGRDVPLLSRVETEKELRVSPQIRSVRMDVFSMDEEQTVYNTEMQDKKKSDLAKRSRYYQSLLDANLLEPGIPDYSKVKASEAVGVKYMQAWEEKYYEREEGREEGRQSLLKEQIQKKLEKGKSVETIAEELEESPEVIKKIVEKI